MSCNSARHLPIKEKAKCPKHLKHHRPCSGDLSRSPNGRNITAGRLLAVCAIWFFYADQNGFDKVIRRAGRRVLIDEQAFFQWLDEQNGGQK